MKVYFPSMGDSSGGTGVPAKGTCPLKTGVRVFLIAGRRMGGLFSREVDCTQVEPDSSILP